MAEKMSMLIVKVDLDCHKCYDKMRKILCKLQDQEGIRMISFDDNSKTIAIAGPFDPQRLACKIRCRGGKTVKDIQIVDVPGGNGKPPPLKTVDAPPAQSPVNNNGRKKQPPPPQPSSPPPEMPHSPPPQPATPDRGMGTTMPPFHEEEKPVPRPAELEPPPLPKANPPPMECYMPPPPAAMNPTRPPPPCPKAPEPFPAECVIPPAEIPSWPAAPVRPCGCPCCAPCYQGYREGCSCGCDGARMYACSAAGPPYGYRGCRIIIEEEPNAACNIM